MPFHNFLPLPHQFPIAQPLTHAGIILQQVQAMNRHALDESLLHPHEPESRQSPRTEGWRFAPHWEGLQQDDNDRRQMRYSRSSPGTGNNSKALNTSLVSGSNFGSRALKRSLKIGYKSSPVRLSRIDKIQ